MKFTLKIITALIFVIGALMTIIGATTSKTEITESYTIGIMSNDKKLTRYDETKSNTIPEYIASGVILMTLGFAGFVLAFEMKVTKQTEEKKSISEDTL